MVANCTGFRSRDLVGDKAVYPVRGHLIRVGIFTYLHLLSFESKKKNSCGGVSGSDQVNKFTVRDER